MHRCLLISLIFLLSCNHGRREITIAGSTSIQPFIERVAEKFMEKYPEIRINVQGGGSTAGIQATYNRTCDIGTSSRNLMPNEKELETVLIARDGIAIIVHKENPIESLTEDEIRHIFSGEIKNWRALDGNLQQIIPVTREEGSGTRYSFQELIMGETEISDACLVQDSNGAVREIIATTPQGIGYISVGLVDKREKLIGVDGVKPTPKNIVSSRYRLVRPFLLLLKEKPKGNVKKFIQFTLKEGQSILQEDGLIPVAGQENER